MKRRILMFIFATTLIIYQPLNLYADVSGITIAGGSIAAGGVAAGAASGPIGLVALAAVGVGLTAAGLNVELTKASQAAGMSKTDFILSKLTEWGNAGDRSLNQINETIANGVSIGKDGVIHLSNQASSQIAQFGNWLFSSDNVINPSNISDESFGTIDGLNMVKTNRVELRRISNDEIFSNHIAQSSTDVYYFETTTNNGYSYFVYGVSMQPFTATYRGDAVTVKQIGNYYYYPATNYSTTSLKIYPDLSNSRVDISSYGNIENYIRSWTGDIVDTSAGVANDTFTGDQADWREKAGLLNPSDGQTAVNPNILSGISTTGSVTMDISDYIDTIIDAINGALPKDVPVTDPITGVKDDVVVPDTAWDPDLDITPEEDLPSLDDTPAIDPDIPADPDETIPSYTIPGLQSIFPFCIPFDIYHMMKKLSADPVAPRYTVNWHIPFANVDLNFTIDLNPYNSVAAILRNMELIVFCIGLALITRNIIRG